MKLRRLSQPTNSKFRSSNPHAASCFTPVDEQFIEPTSKTKTGAKKRKGKSQRRRTSQTHVRQTLTRPVRQSLRRSLRRAEKKRVADAAVADNSDTVIADTTPSTAALPDGATSPGAASSPPAEGNASNNRNDTVDTDMADTTPSTAALPVSATNVDVDPPPADDAVATAAEVTAQVPELRQGIGWALLRAQKGAHKEEEKLHLLAEASAVEVDDDADADAGASQFHESRAVRLLAPNATGFMNLNDEELSSGSPSMSVNTTQRKDDGLTDDEHAELAMLFDAAETGRNEEIRLFGDAPVVEVAAGAEVPRRLTADEQWENRFLTADDAPDDAKNAGADADADM